MSDTTPANGTVSAAAPAPTAHESQLSPLLQDIADRTSDSYKLGLEPRTMDAAWEIAQAAVDARMVESVAEAFARIQIGRPLGIPAMASIQNISFIENKKTGLRTACMMARQKLALCLSRPDIIEYIEAETISNTKAVFIGKRIRGRKEQRYEFTIEDARIAGLVDRGSTEEGKAGNNYTKHPSPMLQWRACGRLCDLIGADILTGIATREEVDDEMTQQREELEALAAAAGRGELRQTLDAPPQAKPARNFAGEAESLKKQLIDAVAAKSKGDLAAFRKAYDVFKAEAPAELSESIQRLYSEEMGKARKAAKPDGAANGTPPVPPPSSPAAAAPPAAKAAPPAPAEPPPGAGDAWEAPADPSEPPFR